MIVVERPDLTVVATAAWPPLHDHLLALQLFAQVLAVAIGVPR